MTLPGRLSRLQGFLNPCDCRLWFVTSNLGVGGASRWPTTAWTAVNLLFRLICAESRGRVAIFGFQSARFFPLVLVLLLLSLRHARVISANVSSVLKVPLQRAGVSPPSQLQHHYLLTYYSSSILQAYPVSYSRIRIRNVPTL